MLTLFLSLILVLAQCADFHHGMGMLLALTFKGKGVWDESHMDNPRINTLIDKISEEID